MYSRPEDFLTLDPPWQLHIFNLYVALKIGKPSEAASLTVLIRGHKLDPC
ncbi:MAG: hypothetical protein ABSG32_02910 [Terriglobia bacterium]